MRAREHLDLGRGYALAHDFRLGGAPEPSRRLPERSQRLAAERQLDRLLSRRPDIGEAHAVGRQQRRKWMNQNARHAERIGDEARVLATGAAEAIEGITRDVVTALHRYFLDGIRHILDGDLDEAVGD